MEKNLMKYLRRIFQKFQAVLSSEMQILFDVI